MSQCTGSKYAAEVRQISVFRSQRQGAVGDKIELRSCTSRVIIEVSGLQRGVAVMNVRKL